MHRIKAAVEMYDYLRQTNNLIRPDLEYFSDNLAWLKKFINNEEHMVFVNSLNTLPRARFLSLDRIPGMDRTSDCWIVMAYNSTRQLESDMKLGESLLTHFNEKCQVGFFDYDFPSNHKFVKSLMIPDTTLLLRYPNSFISTTKFHPRNWQIELRPVDHWGEILYKPAMESLGNDLLKHIEDTIYTQMNDEQKIQAIYSTFNDPEPEKRLMREIIFEYQRSFQGKVRQFMNQVVGTDPSTGEWDQTALEAAYPDIMAYQDQLVESEPIQQYIEERLRNSTYMNTKDYEVEQTTRLTPETFEL